VPFAAWVLLDAPMDLSEGASPPHAPTPNATARLTTFIRDLIMMCTSWRDRHVVVKNVRQNDAGNLDRPGISARGQRLRSLLIDR
jgi:hypothetical protein